ncbi:MAG: RdgB/HAM1 family non-canonical purine NTP pyrophosphatase [Clostridiales bacterium]|nr:RdgB/HAM1 family non-canonical purine NTP pyrophosphatase [Clostridiales bacterium]
MKKTKRVTKHLSKDQFLLATKNAKKRQELKRILQPFDLITRVEEEIGLELDDVEETGLTFEDNALLKARAACAQSGLPSIADDSGLEVDALGGAPGVFSARFAGQHGKDDLNNQKLLEELAGLPNEKRTARFVCAACCVYPDGRERLVGATCEGKIAFEQKGSGGFGYDSLFLPDEIEGPISNKPTMAQLDDLEKDKISHRGKALRLLAQKIGEKL